MFRAIWDVLVSSIWPSLLVQKLFVGCVVYTIAAQEDHPRYHKVSQWACTRHLCLCNGVSPQVHSHYHLTKWFKDHNLRTGKLNQVSRCWIWLLPTTFYHHYCNRKASSAFSAFSPISSTIHVYLYHQYIQEPFS